MIGYNCEKKIMIQAPIKLISLYLINLDYSLMFKSALVNNANDGFSYIIVVLNIR